MGRAGRSTGVARGQPPRDRAWDAWLADANAAFAARPRWGARWWGFGVSHGTFQLVVGDPVGRNLAVMLFWSRELSGPTSWERQRLRVARGPAGGGGRFVVEDPAVGFRAAAESFHWARDVECLDPRKWLLWRPP